MAYKRKDCCIPVLSHKMLTRMMSSSVSPTTLDMMAEVRLFALTRLNSSAEDEKPLEVKYESTSVESDQISRDTSKGGGGGGGGWVFFVVVVCLLLCLLFRYYRNFSCTA